MNTRQNTKSGFTIEQQLHSVRVSQQDRSAVFHDARIAELLVNAIAWVCGKTSRPHADVFAKLSPKY